jgi:hypothetical protein
LVLCEFGFLCNARKGRETNNEGEKGGMVTQRTAFVVLRSLAYLCNREHSVEMLQTAVEVYCALNVYLVGLFVLYTVLYKARLSDILCFVKCFCPVHCAL